MSSRNEYYGDKIYGNYKRDTDDPGRRVHVSKLNKATTLDDIKNFFGPIDKIEAICLNQGFAFIDFKRPTDASAAVSKDKQTFKNHCINVRFFNVNAKREKPIRRTHYPSEGRNLSPPSTRPRYPRRSENYDRRRGDSQSRRRSISPSRRRSVSPIRRSRSRSPNLFRYRDDRYDSAEAPNESGPRAIMAAPNMQEAWQNFNHANMLQQQRAVVAQQQMALSIANRTLPADVELCLKLVIEQKTANNCSLIQIQNIINYFEAARTLISQCNNVSLNPVFTAPNSATQQQLQPQPQYVRSHETTSSGPSSQMNSIIPEPASSSSLGEDPALSASVAEVNRLIREAALVRR